MPLDPRAARFLHALAAGAPAAAPPTLATRRESLRALLRFSETGGRAESRDGTLPGPAGPLRWRLYAPVAAAAPSPGLVFLHGGGLVAGDLDTHDALCRALCEASSCRLVAVAYRLAPEHPFPAAVEDAHAATLWVTRHAAELGIDPARVGILGDSAGGTLAAAVCQMLAATWQARLALQVLLCPILDWAAETPSRCAFAAGYLADRDMMRADLACYLPASVSPAHPLVSPLRGAALGGQPPALIHTAECDPLRDEGRDYAERLREAGVPVRHTCHGGMIHLFYGLGAVIPYARRALARIGADIAAAMEGEKPMDRLAATPARAGAGA